MKVFSMIVNLVHSVMEKVIVKSVHLVLSVIQVKLRCVNAALLVTNLRI